MAQRNEIVCDRCGRTIADLEIRGLNCVRDNSAKILLWSVGAPRSYGGQRIDLCTECAAEFVSFLENTNTEK